MLIACIQTIICEIILIYKYYNNFKQIVQIFIENSTLIDLSHNETNLLSNWTGCYHKQSEDVFYFYSLEGVVVQLGNCFKGQYC